MNPFTGVLDLLAQVYSGTTTAGTVQTSPTVSEGYDAAAPHFVRLSTGTGGGTVDDLFEFVSVLYTIPGPR